MPVPEGDGTQPVEEGGGKEQCSMAERGKGR